MSAKKSQLEKLDENYKRLQDEHGVTGLHFSVGEIKDATPESFAQEVNLVMEAYLNGNTRQLSPGELDDVSN